MINSIWHIKTIYYSIDSSRKKMSCDALYHWPKWSRYSLFRTQLAVNRKSNGSWVTKTLTQEPFVTTKQDVCILSLVHIRDDVCHVFVQCSVRCESLVWAGEGFYISVSIEELLQLLVAAKINCWLSLVLMYMIVYCFSVMFSFCRWVQQGLNLDSLLACLLSSFKGGRCWRSHGRPFWNCPVLSSSFSCVASCRGSTTLPTSLVS